VALNKKRDAEDNGVRSRAGKQSQWAVLSTEQVEGEIQTPQRRLCPDETSDPKLGITSGLRTTRRVTRGTHLDSRSPAVVFVAQLSILAFYKGRMQVRPRRD